jgi:hypothetical protein
MYRVFNEWSGCKHISIIASTCHVSCCLATPTRREEFITPKKQRIIDRADRRNFPTQALTSKDVADLIIINPKFQHVRSLASILISVSQYEHPTKVASKELRLPHLKRKLNVCHEKKKTITDVIIELRIDGHIHNDASGGFASVITDSWQRCKPH